MSGVIPAIDKNKFPRLAAAFAENPENFPHVTAKNHERLILKLDTLWGSKEAVPFLEGLILTDRGGRAGFSLEVMSELLTVKEFYEVKFPALCATPFDPFSFVQPDVGRTNEHEPLRILKSTSAGSAEQRREQDEVSGAAERAAGFAGNETSSVDIDSPTPTVQWAEVSSINQLRQIVEARGPDELPVRDKRLLGEILISHGLVSKKAVDWAFLTQRKQGTRHEPIGEILHQTGATSEENIIRALCQQAGIAMVDLLSFKIESATIKKVPIEAARTYRAIPLAVLGGCLFLAVENPLEFLPRDYFKFMTNLKIELVFSSSKQISRRLVEYG